MIPARLLALPFVLLFGLGIYAAVEWGQPWTMALIPVVMILATIFVFSPQLNWWWWQRFPPDLPEGLGMLLEERFAYYQRLTPVEKREFRRRAFLFMQAHNYIPQVFKTVPEDVRLMLAAPAVAVAFAQTDFLFPKFENIVVYPHPFPSPQYPDHMHLSEFYEPDGVLIFSADHAGRGFMEPHQYFNPSWYEYVRLYGLTYESASVAPLEQVSWEELEAISRFSREAIEKWMNLPDLSKEGLAMSYFFLFPERFQVQLPDLYGHLRHQFQQDPLVFQRTLYLAN